MSIDNKAFAGKIKLFYLLIPFAFTLFIALAIFFDWFNGFDFLIIVAIVFILIIIFINNLKFKYVLFDIQNNIIILRYHGLGPLSPTFNSIEVPAQSLSRFEIKNAFFGLRKELVLYQKTKGGIAKYPGVSISAMPKKERNKIIVILNKVLNLNNKK